MSDIFREYGIIQLYKSNNLNIIDNLYEIYNLNNYKNNMLSTLFVFSINDINTSILNTHIGEKSLLIIDTYILKKINKNHFKYIFSTELTNSELNFKTILVLNLCINKYNIDKLPLLTDKTIYLVKKKTWFHNNYLENIKYSLELIGYNCQYYEDNLKNIENSIIITIDSLKDIDNNICVLFNLEPFPNIIKKYIHNNIKIIDYNIYNVFLTKKIYNYDSCYIPYSPNYIKNFEIKNKDICVFPVNTLRRKKIYEMIKEKINKCDESSDRFISNNILNYKIVISTPKNETQLNCYCNMRLSTLVYNKIIVIQEISKNIDSKNLCCDLHDYVIFCNIDNLLEIAIDVYNNYDIYYKKLFGNFNINNILNQQLKLLNNVIKYIIY